MSTIDAEVTVTDANESGAITGPTTVNYPENAHHRRHLFHK